LEKSASPEEQFIEYLEKNKGLIVKVAGVYCYDHDNRKDLIQDIIFQLWKSYSKFNDDYAISTWTYRIALNVSISYLRKLTTRKKTQEAYRQHAEWMHWDAPGVDERLEQLYQSIDFLKPVDKAIIVLHLDGLKNKEVAEILGIPATNVSTKLLRIKETLGKQLSTSKR
jgi:RNA polymerase sigma-70 factor (ECF subfamily)